MARNSEQDGLGEAPLVTLGASLSSFKPDDEMILSATRFSGVPAFIELLDVPAIDQLDDPLREQVKQALG